MGLLAALVLERLGPKRWARRWANPGRALRPLGEVPEESLAYLQRCGRGGGFCSVESMCGWGRRRVLGTVPLAPQAGHCMQD